MVPKPPGRLCVLFSRWMRSMISLKTWEANWSPVRRRSLKSKPSWMMSIPGTFIHVFGSIYNPRNNHEKTGVLKKKNDHHISPPYKDWQHFEWDIRHSRHDLVPEMGSNGNKSIRWYIRKYPKHDHTCDYTITNWFFYLRSCLFWLSNPIYYNPTYIMYIIQISIYIYMHIYIYI